MAFKFVIISCLVAMAHAGNIPVAVVAEPAATLVAAPVPVAARLEEFDYPQYKYSYTVADSITGDFKSQTEERNGDVVLGEYTVQDPDFTLRTTKYIADKDGFRPIITKENLIAEPAAVAVAEPAVVPARLAAAPVAPVAPVASVFPSARYVASAPAPFFAPGFAAAYTPFSRFAAPFSYPAQQIVAV